MAIDERLPEQIRGALGKRRGVTERRMFGGVCFMLNGNMLCGAGGMRGRLLLRVGKGREAQALARGARPMVMNGRRMGGFVFVHGLDSDARALKQWLDFAARHVAALPPKTPKKMRSRSPLL